MESYNSAQFRNIVVIQCEEYTGFKSKQPSRSGDLYRFLY